MNTKLTLSVKKDTVRKARRYADHKGITISRIFEDHINELSRKRRVKKKKSVVDGLVGIIKGIPDDRSDKEIIAAWRSEKHGI
ncbi:MAG: DUF6364 family protein [Chitinophagales bacterium]